MDDQMDQKDLKYGGYCLYTKLDSWDLITLGDIRLWKENRKNGSRCRRIEERFNYYGIKNALCGKTDPDEFTSKRILVIQMK